jgi:hypothetical protein
MNSLILAVVPLPVSQSKWSCSVSTSSSLLTYLGEDGAFTLHLLSLAMRQVCFPWLRLGKSDLHDEDPLMATVATPSSSELELSSFESQS